MERKRSAPHSQSGKAALVSKKHLEQWTPLVKQVFMSFDVHIINNLINMSKFNKTYLRMKSFGWNRSFYRMTENTLSAQNHCFSNFYGNQLYRKSKEHFQSSAKPISIFIPFPRKIKLKYTNRIFFKYLTTNFSNYFLFVMFFLGSIL